MSKLGDFLEVLCRPSEPFHTLVAQIRHTRFDAQAQRASDASHPIGRRKIDTASNSTFVENLSVWIARPDCLRIESETSKRGKLRRELSVVSGQRTWVRDHEGHVESSSGGRHPVRDACSIERHFDRGRIRAFVAGLAWESQGEVETAGQHCVRVRAIPLPDGRLWPHWIPRGADEYEFHCDPRHAAILTIIARSQGTVFETNEVTSVEFDSDLRDELFTYSPGVGEPDVPPVPICESLTLAAAVKRMPFTVLTPARLPNPDHAQLDVMYHPPRTSAPRAYLMLNYRLSADGSWHDSRRSLWISQSAVPDPEDAQLEWESVEYAGRQLRLSDPGKIGMRVVALESAGTYVNMTSDVDRDGLLDLATSLVPAQSK